MNIVELGGDTGQQRDRGLNIAECSVIGCVKSRGEGAYNRGEGAYNRGEGAYNRGEGAYNRGEGAYNRVRCERNGCGLEQVKP